MAKSLNATMKKLKSQQIIQKKSSVKEQAKNNAVVSKGSKSAGYETLKEGTPLDHATKHDVITATDSKFGMNIGVTKNMDNYESLRVDVWATDVPREGESLQQAYARLQVELEEVIENVVAEYGA